MAEKVYCILLAGGTGSRMGADRNKVLLPVAGIPCIARSAAALAPFVDQLVLVGRPEEEKALRAALEAAALSLPVSFVPGGNTRQQSVHHGLRRVCEMEADNVPVLIHDGARCLVEAEVIRRVLDSVLARGSGVAAVPVTDTLRAGDDSMKAGSILPREGLYAMQTPQGARLQDLICAFDRAEKAGFTGTDDAAVLAFAGYPVYLVRGSRNNLKLTTREDLIMAESMLQKIPSPLPAFRVGFGYDVHRLVENRKLILCGVEVPHTLGLLGHSDADVAIHALMDALLGAAALGDIGRHFPDFDPRYKGIDSRKLLAAVMEKIQAEGFRPVNADVTIAAQKPKLAPFIPAMAANLAQDLGLPLSCVNVKATTTEHLGFEGRQEGISAQAVCMIVKE